MKMYIPTIGDEIKLTKDWSLTLHYERRNKSVFKRFDLDPYNLIEDDLIISSVGYRILPDYEIAWVIPAGTILKISRIYIRNGQSDFDSVTFSGKETGRFWAKLEDVNEIEFEVCSSVVEQ